MNRGGKQGVPARGMKFLFGMIKMSCHVTAVTAALLSDYSKPLNCTLKRVIIMMCKLHLSKKYICKIKHKNFLTRSSGDSV